LKYSENKHESIYKVNIRISYASILEILKRGIFCCGGKESGRMSGKWREQLDRAA
jgi:hypothetical protein